ncbi:MAG: tetratricopeptide repeat protein [Desulfobacteraceae bacterium]|nr:tetratricopeptide repeat protein [Desulfobacteraceae bacterium]
MPKITVCIGFILLILGCIGAASGVAWAEQTQSRLCTQFLSNARSLEERGDFPAALEKYKIALTVDPSSSAAEKGRARVSRILSQSADHYYQLGWQYYEQGKYGLTLNAFLTALKYQPDNPQASKILISRPLPDGYVDIVHVMQPGETLSTIAKEYYGDYKKFDVLAHYNHIDDAAMVPVGQQISVPQLSSLSLSLLIGKEIPWPLEAAAVAQASWPTEEKQRLSGPVTGSQDAADEQILAYRKSGIDLFKQGKYTDAVFELNKVVQAAPKDALARNYLAKAYYQQAMADENNGNYLKANKSYEAALRCDPECTQCAENAKRSMDRFKETHYTKGNVHFTKGELADAMMEWQMVYDADPKYQEVEQNLTKAKSLLEKMGKIKNTEE